MPALFAVGYLFVQLQYTLPDTEGEITLVGLHEQVSITRDIMGAVSILGQTDEDVFFALGYAHAQDRLWQLELQRRTSRGELSEIFGKSALNFDIYVRTLGIYRASQTSFEVLNEEAKASLNAYVSGINSWLALGRKLPPEFTILDIEAKPWTPVDSIATVKLFALNMSSNYQQELNNLILAQSLDQAHFESFTGSKGLTTELTRLTSSSLKGLVSWSKLYDDIELQWRIGGNVIGSNAWAISAAHSTTGTAAIANDPHLSIELPSSWYAVELKGSKIDVSGMNLVGLPIVMLGKNANIAWAGTNLMADTQDLFFERINETSQQQYFFDNEWIDIEKRYEEIQVKSDFPAMLREPLAPVEISIRSTHNGPIVSDMVAGVEQPTSLKWAGASPQDTSYEAFFELNYAADWPSFKRALAKHIAPAMNLVYADLQNNIGYQAIGRVPIRGQGKGKLPLAGWEKQNDWLGYIPFKDMPTNLNPESGYIVNANNQVVDDAYPYFISDNWAEPARANRINALLEEKIKLKLKLSIKDHQDIQQDLVDNQALALLPLLLNLPESTGRNQILLSYLRQWDGKTDVTSVAATIFFAWAHNLRTELFQDELAANWSSRNNNARLSGIIRQTTLSDLQNALLSSGTDWCDKINTPAKESCQKIMFDALKQADADMSLLLGKNIDDWHWGDAHKLRLQHRPFSNVRGLDFLFDREVSNGGSFNSINVSGARFDKNTGFSQFYGAGFRQVMHFDEGGQNHSYVNSTGQSGNLISPHYDDMLQSYVGASYFSLRHERHHHSQLLMLNPKR
ncbi:penicillin acylase family protein [Paraglaciecola sp.]|uniref:penicillin acylase family protein n=1 Tax=Paraglaciecola sp. TaxID=1920173 RepID=UPI0030F4A477